MLGLFLETHSGISPSPSISSPQTNVETTPTPTPQSTFSREEPNEEAPQLESFSEPVTDDHNSSNDHVASSLPSTSTVREVVVRTPGVGVVRKLSAPCNIVYRQANTPSKPGTPIRTTKQVR
ncbi:unnamed protein product [Strongylus vulgaris]|uniref:Uncharacterized protein n=1 Tax=Strongylus vulgaris TaxID=40348 RepID=A0A3P7J3E8_STRVU|nr:unnamed protein product [Strongylus vulgaris]